MNDNIKEKCDPQSCIIIHPGSKNLRIGTPSDASPHTMLHAIALRRKNQSLINEDLYLPQFVKVDRQAAQEIEECRLRVSHILQSSLQSDGTRRFATPPQQVAAFNKRCTPHVVPNTSPSPPWLSTNEEVVVGDDVSNLKPGSDYNVHFPFKKGELNIHSGVGGTTTAVLSYLEFIWKFCIQKYLNLPLEELKNYNCVLVIPCIYNRDHIKHLVQMLFCNIGFGNCFVVQDHVSATFGAGLGGACVVDVGASKTSVSCVEDAMSHHTTRIRLDYGGSDVSQVLHWLLRKSCLPHPIEVSHRKDAVLLDSIKEDFCHINLNKCGPEEKQLRVCMPDQVPRVYVMQMGDELLIAPLSLFYPELLHLTGQKTMFTHRHNQGHPDDPLDENFLRDTSRRGGREAAEALDVADAVEGVVEEEMVVEESTPGPPYGQGGTCGQGGAYTPRQNGSVNVSDRLLSLDQAILASIERCASDEMKRKMYSTILVVGGGAKFDMMGKWLQNRLALQIPVAFRPDQIEVITRPKDLDPCMTVWKGAALLCGLEGSHDLWISQEDWDKYGVKVLREKCPFLW